MNPMRRIGIWAGRIGLGRKLAIALAIPALASGVATYLALTGAPPFGPHPNAVLSLLNLDLILLLALGAVITKRLIEVWAERRRGLAGSRLQIRLVVLFSLIAVMPTIIVAGFSYLFFSFGVESWFSERVRTAITESLAVAEAYLHEHQQAIRADVLAMANDLNRDSVHLALNPQHLEQVVSAQAALRGLTEAMVFDRAGHMLARSSLSFALGFEPIPDDAIHLADAGDVAIMTNDSDDRVRALVRLNQFGDVYLYVGRFIEPRVLNHMEETQRAAALYEQMEGQRSGFQITFALIFMMVALLFLVAAVAIGIHFATQFAGPISQLITAAEQVRSGDLAARVPEGKKDDELASLSRAFNRMTYQIESQQRELREANRQLDERRRFTETVLTGVSAGVIGLDSLGRINLPNRSASALLGTDLEQAIGQDLAEVGPEMAGLLGEAERRPERLAQSQIELIRGNSTRTLLVRIAAEYNGRNISGFVVTFDDITELLSAQRKAAWADIARRIAHEIKNPLTPIQLAAERLRRRYLKEIKKDVETFTICTDTIIRHVGDIGRMIDEFSSFARMPTPVLRPENLVEIVHRAVFLQRTAHPEINFEPVFPARPVVVNCDARLIGQALINIVKNAIESIEARNTEDSARPLGRIRVSVVEEDGQAAVFVEDNGKGLPQQGREQLTEPYVTTRTKGTGLGLAIVKKIMEDHHGELVLEDGDPEGARVSLHFAASEVRIAQPTDVIDEPMELSPAGHGA
ncbi:MAG: PAS domain-containing sensor histidine kinase [Alphaproteobacteria bacterium]|nr:PAS domain-containing sensor histidine kinase [Alphaproteobacteria bacterium]